MSNDLTTHNVELTPPVRKHGFLSPTSLAEAQEAAKVISESNFCPKDYKGRPGDIIVCLQMGQELEVPPMTALQGIAVINGRPAVWGDLLLAICRRCSDWEYIEETLDEESMTALCKTKRRNEPPVIRTFSKADAEKANLWTKDGTWKNYPKRMLQMRARALALRDCYTEQLKGLYSAEEVVDIPPEDYSVIRNDPKLLTELINDTQIHELREKLKECNRSEMDVCAHKKIDNIECMTLGDWYELIRILDAAILKKYKAAKAPINNVMKEPPQKTAEKQALPSPTQKTANASTLNEGFEAADSTVDDFFGEEV